MDKDKVKKYSWLFHVLIVVSFLSLYYSYPPYEKPSYIYVINQVLGIAYGTFGIFNLKTYLEQKHSSSLKAFILFMALGLILLGGSY